MHVNVISTHSRTCMDSATLTLYRYKGHFGPLKSKKPFFPTIYMLKINIYIVMQDALQCFTIKVAWAKAKL